VKPIAGHVAELKAVCARRGYTLAETAACIISRDGDTVTVDVDHPAYPRAPKPQSGPGTELKKLLASIGITATPNCKCNARVKHMDAMEAQEPGWCERNIDTVVGYLRESAADRGLPFLDAAGRVLVRRAISNARKEAARATQATTAEGSEAETR
jgi:hypothetical protein